MPAANAAYAANAANAANAARSNQCQIQLFLNHLSVACPLLSNFGFVIAQQRPDCIASAERQETTETKTLVSLHDPLLLP
eukprot:365763-Chlamydomonas_euryale.AAC.14